MGGQHNSLSPFVHVYVLTRNHYYNFRDEIWRINASNVTTFMNGAGQGANFILACYSYPYNLNVLSDVSTASGIYIANQYLSISGSGKSVMELLPEYQRNSPLTNGFTIEAGLPDDIKLPLWYARSNKCKYKLYLPYIGFIEIDSLTAIDYSLSINYSIDATTSIGICELSIFKETSFINTHHLEFSAGFPVPITGADNANIVQSQRSALSQTLTGLGAVAIGGALEAYGVLSPEPLSKTLALAAGGALTAVGGVANMATGIQSTMDLQKYAPTMTGLSNVSGGAQYSFNITPFILCVYDDIQDYNGQEHYYGKPCFKEVTINSLKGYARFARIHVEIDNATEPEKTELEQLLTQGVIVNYG